MFLLPTKTLHILMHN